jgi:hypothetical protein
MTYANPDTRRLALEDLEIITDCARKLHIEDRLFVGFGLLLGMVRENDFIGHDDDVDMCLQSDKITAQQEMEYFVELHKRGMFFSRRKWSTRKADDGLRFDLVAPMRQCQGSGIDLNLCRSDGPKERLTWFSLRRRPENHKICHWLMFKWGGYYWHTKAGKWLNRAKFDPEAIEYLPTDGGLMKGIPEACVEELEAISFHGVRLNIPRNYGRCLDWWYPGWLTPIKGGSSAKTVVCRVVDWLDRSTWKVKVLSPSGH